MRKQPTIGINSAEIVTVLSVSPMEEDGFSLESIFNRSNWKLSRTHSLASAVAFLQARRLLWFFVNVTCGRVPGAICWSESPACPMRRPSL